MVWERFVFESGGCVGVRGMVDRIVLVKNRV